MAALTCFSIILPSRVDRHMGLWCSLRSAAMHKADHPLRTSLCFSGVPEGDGERQMGRPKALIKKMQELVTLMAMHIGNRLQSHASSMSVAMRPVLLICLPWA